jgi:hypothetical protein
LESWRLKKIPKSKTANRKTGDRKTGDRKTGDRKIGVVFAVPFGGVMRVRRYRV